MSLFENYNANDLPEDNKFGSNTKVIRIKDEPIICKLAPVMNLKDNAGKPLLYYPYSRFTFSFVKDGKKVNYTRPSLKVKGENDPQFDLYLKLRADMKQLDKTSIEYKNLDELSKKHKPSRKGVLFVHVLGSKDIQAMEVPESVINQLFGKEAFDNKPAKEGLYQSLRRTKNKNIFDVMALDNWLKFSRTGTDFYDTEYTVELHKVPKIVDEEEVEVVFKHEVSPSLKELKDTDLPDAIAVASEYSWDKNEVDTYLATGNVPEKVFGHKRDNQTKTAAQAPGPQYAAPAQVSSAQSTQTVNTTQEAPKGFAESFETVFR